MTIDNHRICCYILSVLFRLIHLIHVKNGGNFMIKLDLQSRIPLYEQLEEQIIRLSLLGVLDEHEQLPSVRALARDVGVNPNTVAKAYQELERQGIIYTVTGKGSFVSPDVLSLEQPRKAALEEVFAAVDKALSRGLSKEQLLDSIREHLQSLPDNSTNSQEGNK